MTSFPCAGMAARKNIAGLYVYLASDEATYATGGIFTFDGAESVGSAATTL